MSIVWSFIKNEKTYMNFLHKTCFRVIVSDQYIHRGKHFYSLIVTSLTTCL